MEVGKKKKKKKEGKLAKETKKMVCLAVASDSHVHGGCAPVGRVEKRIADARKKSRECCKNPGTANRAHCVQPNGGQYRPQRSGDWRIFLRIGRHCWIFVKLYFSLTQRPKLPSSRIFAPITSSFFLFFSLPSISKVSENQYQGVVQRRRTFTRAPRKASGKITRIEWTNTMVRCLRETSVSARDRKKPDKKS